MESQACILRAASLEENGPAAPGMRHLLLRAKLTLQFSDQFVEALFCENIGNSSEHTAGLFQAPLQFCPVVITAPLVWSRLYNMASSPKRFGFNWLGA